jgi:hypothetical protein
MNLTDIYRVFRPAAVQYRFFSAVNGPFSKIEHILGHKACHRKWKKVKITPLILSNYNRIQLELKAKKKKTNPDSKQTKAIK